MIIRTFRLALVSSLSLNLIIPFFQTPHFSSCRFTCALVPPFCTATVLRCTTLHVHSPLERRATTAETGPVPPAFYFSLQAADEGQLVVQDGWVVAPLHSRRRLSKKKKKMVEEIETVVASGGSGGGGDGDGSDDDGDNDDDVDDVDKHGAYGSEDGSDSDSEMEDSGVSGGGGRPPCSCCKDPSDVGDGTVCQPCEHYNPISSSEEGEEVEEGSKQHRRRRSAAQAAERLEAKTKAKEAKNKAAAERRAYQVCSSFVFKYWIFYSCVLNLDQY